MTTKQLQSKAKRIGDKVRGVAPVRFDIGTQFDTNFEKGCVVTALPDSDGMFLALDSDGIECQFGLRSVIKSYGTIQ